MADKISYEEAVACGQHTDANMHLRSLVLA